MQSKTIKNAILENILKIHYVIAKKDRKATDFRNEKSNSFSCVVSCKSLRENFRTRASLVCFNFSVYIINVTISKTRQKIFTFRKAHVNCHSVE